MDEALGPSIEDYLRSIRRSGRGIVLAAAVGALLLALLNAATGGVSTRYRTVTQVSRVDEASMAIAYGLPPDLVAQRTLPQEAVRAREALRNELKSKLPTDAVVAVNANEPANILSVTAVAPSADGAKTAAELAMSSIVDQRRGEATDRLKAVDAFQAERLASLTDRLTVLDGQLAKPLDDAQRRSAELERLSVLDEQIVAQRSAIGTKQLIQSTRGGITDPIVIVAPKSELSLGWVTSAIVGLVLGAIVGLAWTVVRTFLDRRVRSRADLEMVVAADQIVGVVPAGDEAARTAGFASVVRRLTGPDGPGLVVAACTDARSATTTTTELERLALGSVTDAAPALGRDGSIVRALSSGQRVLLVASYGSTTRDDLAASVASVMAAQADFVGVVLVGVPARELGLALRSRSVMRSA